ncbi:MAG: HD domain-containing protein [Thermoleophilia bacterium]|nr:HD domain-containing protein [Thermoleophilia bacterium]
MTALAEIMPGGPFEGVYAVRGVERRLARSGRPFLSVELADASGTARAVVFEQPDWFRERLTVGAPAHIAGRASERGGRLELVIAQVREAGDADAGDLVPRSHRDPDELFGFVLHLADEVHEPGLRRVLDALTGDAALARAWRSVPCTRSGHHAYAGGLVEHTVGVAAVCQTLCTWHPRLDPDLLVAAALVHDLGYTRAWSVGATVEATEAGRLLGHVGLGVDLVGEACRRVRLPQDRMLALLHCVAWHHGPPPGQAPGGASPEAVALMRANDLEVRVKSRLEGGGLDAPAQG